MRLSPHFSLAEFTYSDTAQKRKIDNTPTKGHIAKMTQLCENVLEPVRAHFNRPVRITSGFRSPALCIAIGSKKTSQHAKGEAADFEITGISNYELAKWIRDNITFDQLILENYIRGNPNSGWIHCSYRADRLRNQTLTYSRRSYFNGLVA
ncbi:D-Ala-D-Ala carboxypeptidase family metallohydrolase [Parasphingorhabdus sp. JC815]|uniref:D-Ala-D-Ala carboxypeptidase family metallohydrolase n=1 Tax=Parasphingorhabdus sp. JC815 TaxID=3232140 RepID=UPI003459915C